MKSLKHYSVHQKDQIVLELLNEEKTVSQIASEHGIHPNQLHRWIAFYSDRSGDFEAYLMRSDDTEHIRLVRESNPC